MAHGAVEPCVSGWKPVVLFLTEFIHRAGYFVFEVPERSQA